MNKFIHLFRFVLCLFDDGDTARKATPIVEGIMKARSPRLSDIAREMCGNETANYKHIQRFVDKVDPREAQIRLFQSEAPFMIGDPTEIPRPQAEKTEYVGTLSDGETCGYGLLLLATPFHGRALPCHFVSYSSKTINRDATSCNRYHLADFAQVKELLGDKPLVLDREFSYLELLENLVAEGVNFVIRLKVGPNFCNGEGKPVVLSVSEGETRVLNKVFYKGKVFVNVIGFWRKGFSQSLWVMTNLKAEDGLAIYFQRMKIEEAFHDLKSLLNFHKLMNKRRVLMGKMVALLLIAYAITLILGETLRQHLFPDGGRKQQIYSGPFIFLKLKPTSPLLSSSWHVLPSLRSFALSELMSEL